MKDEAKVVNAKARKREFEERQVQKQERRQGTSKDDISHGRQLFPQIQARMLPGEARGRVDAEGGEQQLEDGPGQGSGDDGDGHL